MFKNISYKDIFNKEEIPIQSINEITILSGDKEIGRFIGIHDSEQDTNFKYDPYFKYCDSYSFKKSKYVARISIMRPEYIIHRNNDGKTNWFLNSKERKELSNILFNLGYYNKLIDKIISKNIIDESIKDKLIQLKNNPPNYSQLRRD